MKKLLVLILAAALALSLVACGGGAGNNNTPSTGNGDTTSTDTHSTPDIEKLLAEAQNVKLREIFSAYDENKLNAEDTYVGNTYQIFGYVKNIESEYCELEAAFYGNVERLSKTLKVYLERDALKELYTGEGIHVVGTVSSIDSAGITMETACYVDNKTSGIFTAKFINEDNCNGKSIVIIDSSDGTYDCDTTYTVYLDRTAISSLHSDDFILATGTAYVEQIEGAFPASYRHMLKDAEIIVQGQNEITEYLKSLENE